MSTDEDYPRSIVDVEELKSRLNSETAATGSPSQQRHAAKQSVPQSAKTGDAWLLRQQLQDACHDLIISNNGNGAELAVSKRVEQDLWNYAFRQQIALLETQFEQQQSSNASAIHLAATRTSLQYFLELATGFYVQLMEEINLIASLDVYPLCRDRDHFGALSPVSISSSSSLSGSTMPRSIATYLVQHCLVHLGDLARYMAKLAPSSESSSEASVDHLEIAQHYYVAAAMLVPFSGQPFNQLAIVEAQQGNRLGAAYLYARALSARSPFPAAEQNLTRLLERILASSPLVKEKQQQQHPTIVPPKSIAELVTVCIQILATAWLKPTQQSNFVATTLLSHLGSAAQSFLSDRVGSTFSWFQLVQLAFLNAFIVSRRHNSQQSKIAFSFTVLFLNHLVRELVATAKSDTAGGVSFGRSPLLPATRLLLSFLAANANVLLNSPDLLNNNGAGEDNITDIRSPRLWHSVAKLADYASLASLKSSLSYTAALPEDVELRGCNLFSECFSPSAKSPTDSGGGGGGVSPQDRANSADVHIDFENGAFPSYTSSSSPSSSTTTVASSSSAVAFLACARFSETCVRLSASVPSFLVVLSSDPCPRFASPLPVPTLQQQQQQQSHQSSVAAIIMSSLPISKSQGSSSIVSSQSYMIKSSTSEFPNSTPDISTTKQPALLPTPFAHSSSSSSIGPTSTGAATTAPAAAPGIGDRPRNVVFQSIVHTMRARGAANPQQAATLSNNDNSNNNNSNNLPSSNAASSPRLAQRFNSQAQQPGSGSNTPRNYANPLTSNSNNGSSNNIAEDSDSKQDSLRSQGSSMHRNLPPRLARLAEAEANSRANSASNLASGLNNAHNSPRGMPLHINLSSSTSSSSSSVSSGRQTNPTTIQPTIPSFRQQQPQPNLFGQLPNVDRFSDLSDSRNARGSAFQSTKLTAVGFGGLADDSSKNNYKASNTAADNNNNNSAPVDDGWPVLACLRNQLPTTATDSAPQMRNIHSDPSLAVSKNRMPPVPSTLNEIGKLEQMMTNSSSSNNNNNSSAQRLHSDALLPPSTTASSSANAASDRATAFSLFGLHTFDSDNNWPWNLVSSSSSVATNSTTSTTVGSTQPSSNCGWSPMLSAVSAFTQNNSKQQQQTSVSTSAIAESSLLQSLTASAGALRSQQQQQQQPAVNLGGNLTSTGKDNSSQVSSLFGCAGNTTSSSSSGNLGDFGGWSQLQPNGISPTRLWSAFGFDLHKTQIGDSAAVTGHAPPTPPN